MSISSIWRSETDPDADLPFLSKSQIQLIKGVEPNQDFALPDLTVVVAAYRHEDYIDECLASINNSSLKSLELLIIDDGSPDKTLAKCLSFAFRPEIEVRIYTKNNRGLAHSLFSGLERARGRYVAFIASDDLYIKDGLKTAINILQQSSPSIDALLCQAIAMDSRKKSRYVYGPSMDKLFRGTAFDRFDEICTLPPSPMLLQSTIFKTKHLQSLKPWTDNLELDDWPTFIRLFAAEAHHSAVVRYESKIKLCMYRIHEHGIHNNLDRQLKLTTQVASSFVPKKYRNACLANAKIGNGLIHIYEGRIFRGINILLQSFLTNPSISATSLLTKRGCIFMSKKFNNSRK